MTHYQGEGLDTTDGVIRNDRAGNTFAERLKAAATGLYAAAERMGERLRGIAEDVFAYATGQRDAERAGHAVESAGATLERADRTLEPVIQREQEIRDERLMQEREHALSPGAGTPAGNTGTHTGWSFVVAVMAKL